MLMLVQHSVLAASCAPLLQEPGLTASAACAHAAKIGRCFSAASEEFSSSDAASDSRHISSLFNESWVSSDSASGNIEQVSGAPLDTGSSGPIGSFLDEKMSTLCPQECLDVFVLMGGSCYPEPPSNSSEAIVCACAPDTSIAAATPAPSAPATPPAPTMLPPQPMLPPNPDAMNSSRPLPPLQALKPLLSSEVPDAPVGLVPSVNQPPQAPAPFTPPRSPPSTPSPTLPPFAPPASPSP
eukprot:6209575-Pleurochrysis_carterae.AAC.1